MDWAITDPCVSCNDSNHLEGRAKQTAKCGHAFCDRCRQRLGVRSTCPGCGEVIGAFSLKSREQLEFEAEQDKRQLLMESYARTRRDFATDDDYNSYLEQVEDIIYDLAHGTLAQKEEARRRLETLAADKEANVRGREHTNDEMHELRQRVERERAEMRKMWDHFAEEDRSKLEHRRKQLELEEKLKLNPERFHAEDLSALSRGRYAEEETAAAHLEPERERTVKQRLVDDSVLFATQRAGGYNREDVQRRILALVVACV